MTEFGLIDHIRALCAHLPAAGFEGIGDDCAVLPIGNGEALVFTTDLLCEGVHFLRNATTPEELGGKSLAVNLSDVASMGARPIATLLSLSLPTDATGAWAEAFTSGYCAASARYGTALVGGDTTGSTSGITISVTAIGRAPEGHLKRRSAACIGDRIFTTGPLGRSAVGLRDILSQHFDTEAAATHRNPVPQIEEGVWLGSRSEVHAMMDLSDGLGSDIRHIMEQSHVGAEIDLARIPLAAGADVRTALCGGEDYQLLLTADQASAATLCRDFEARFGRRLYELGSIIQADPATPTQPRWMHDGIQESCDFMGFEHF